MNRVFVYGSLKKGLFLHWAIQHCKFLGTFETGKYLDLLAVSEHAPFPIVTRGDYKVRGEVYEVDDDLLHHLDVVEGGYDRCHIMIDGIEGKVNIYMLPYRLKEEYHFHKNVDIEDDVKVWNPPYQTQEDLYASGLVKPASKFVPIE